MGNIKLELDPLSLFSHEIKTPLNTLKMGLDIIGKNPNSKDNREIIRLMEEELSYLTDFINGYLDFRLLKDKKDLMKFQWGSWKEVLFKALDSFQIPAQRNNVLFKVNNRSPKDFGEKDYEIFMDSRWMVQVLKNLLSNGLKFSPENSTLFIDYEYLPHEGLQCAVTDEGEGFSEKESSRLFELFYTKPLSSQKEEKGTGLGLAIVKTIVENHGGFVKASPSKEVGRGAVFSFCIPKVRPAKRPDLSVA